MARYRVIYLNPVNKSRGYYSVNDHKRAVAIARNQHRHGEHVTVRRADNQNVVIWLGGDAPLPFDGVNR